MMNSTKVHPAVHLSFVSQVTWSFIYSLLAAVIVFFNTLVILSFAKNKALRTRTNSFIVSLAWAALLVRLVSLPGYTSLILTQYSNRVDVLDTFKKAWVAFDILAGVGSILHLTALSWDRFCAIVWPLKHRSYTRKKYLLILCSIWVCTILVSALSIIGNDKALRVYNITVIIVCFFVPLGIICLAQGLVLITIRSKTREEYRNVNLRLDLRVAKTISIMTVVFIIGWLPFFTLSLISYTDSATENPPWNAIFAVKFFQYGNSVFNPILYAQKFPEFRRAYMLLVFRCCPALQPKEMWNVRNSTKLAYLNSPNAEVISRKTVLTNLATRSSCSSATQSTRVLQNTSGMSLLGDERKASKLDHQIIES